MDSFFYSPTNGEVKPEEIKEKYHIKYSFNDKNIPHFAKTGVATIHKVYENTVEIIINKDQTFIDTSLFGENIDLDSGIFLHSLFENNDIVLFEIPKKYIWCISNEQNI